MLAATTYPVTINVSVVSLSAFERNLGWRMPAGVHGMR